MIIAMRALATKPDAPPKLICLMMSGRGRCPHLRRPDKRGSTVHIVGLTEWSTNGNSTI